MQAPYESTELKYDPYQISMVNAAITFGNPNHMAKVLNSLQHTDIKDYESDTTDKNQLILKRVVTQTFWVIEFAKSRALYLAEEIGRPERHQRRAKEEVNMLWSMIKNYANKFEIDVEHKEQFVRSKLEQILDERIPLN